MKQIPLVLFVVLFFFSCHKKSAIVNVPYIDSLMNHYDTPAAVKANNADMQFWKNKILPGTADYTHSLKYAATCIKAYHFNGDFSKVLEADSLLNETAHQYNGKEAAPYMAMVQHCILEHRFNDADSFFTIAQHIGIKPYDINATAFDIAFEKGQIDFASLNLAAIAAPSDYGYQFRMSKLMHYKGNMDSAIKAMQRASTNAGNEKSLQLAALSNLGDLYIHSGALQNAYDCYNNCLKISTADLHSLMGIGWIALVADGNDSLAERIFRFVSTRTQSPEPFLKLLAVAEYRMDTAHAIQYAKAFEQEAAQIRYGNMYNKYLLQLYTGILNQPAKAVALAQQELVNRRTPQTYAWYAWALYKNGSFDQSLKVYQDEVSGKPLEAVELYWMGKLMQHLGKGYNAAAYLKAATENRYDLSPSAQKELLKLSSQ